MALPVRRRMSKRQTPKVSLGRRRVLAATGGLLALGLAKPAFADALDPSQRPAAVYVSETGHHLSGPILKWWLQYGRETLLGWPVTEIHRILGRRVQFFERGALAEQPETADPLGVVQLDLGAWWLRRRAAQGALAPDTAHEEAFAFSATGRGVHPTLWPAFLSGGGAFAYGLPLRWASESSGAVSQLFERAHLVDGPGGPKPYPLGWDEAVQLGLPTEPVRQNRNIPAYDPGDWALDMGPSAERYVDVDLSRQVATFMSGERPVYEAIVSTGLDPDFTPTGYFRIFMRLAESRLVSLGNTSKTYDFDNVRFVQYFTEDWVGFHHVYWHDDFGTERSAGCVNLRQHDAQFAWDFCSHGTLVRVHRPA